MAAAAESSTACSSVRASPPLASITASGDGWGGRRFTADLDQPLSGTVGLRLNGLFEDSDSFRHHVDLKRYGINPTVALQAGPDTRIDLSYEYFHDRRTADRGVPARGDEPIRGFTRTFFGDPRLSYSKADVNLGDFCASNMISAAG